MGHDENRFPFIEKRSYTTDTLSEKIGVSNTQGFVDEENVRMNGGRNRKGQPHVHSIRIGFHWLMDEILQFGELDDVHIEPVDFLLGQPEIHPTRVDILPPGQFRMKSRSEL